MAVDPPTDPYGSAPARSSVEILAASDMDASVVRRLVEAYNRVDPGAISDLLTEEVVVRIEVEGAIALEPRGLPAVLEAMATRRSAWQRDWIESKEIKGVGDGVIVEGRWRGHRARTGAWEALDVEARARLEEGRVPALTVRLHRPAAATARPTRRLGGLR